MTGEGVLVRDCMKWKIHNVQPYVRQVGSDQELLMLLKKKLLEEVGELLTAPRRREVLEELADIQQVLRLYANLHRYSTTQVEEARKAKWQEKGGFGGGVVLAWRQPEPGSDYGQAVNAPLDEATVAALNEKLASGDYPVRRVQPLSEPLGETAVRLANDDRVTWQSMKEAAGGLRVPEAQPVQREPGAARGASHPEGGGGLGITGRQVPRRGR